MLVGFAARVVEDGLRGVAARMWLSVDVVVVLMMVVEYWLLVLVAPLRYWLLVLYRVVK